MTFLQYLQKIHAFTTMSNEWVNWIILQRVPPQVCVAAQNFGYVEHRYSEINGSEYRLTAKGYASMKNDELMLSMDC